MSDAKLNYQRATLVLKQQAEHSTALSKTLYRAKERYLKHKSKERAVNLNEIVEKYAPGAVPYFDNYKIIYHVEGSKFSVVCDPSGYLRILIVGTDFFVDCFSDEILSTTYTKDPKMVLERTHFRIKRREEL